MRDQTNLLTNIVIISNPKWLAEYREYLDMELKVEVQNQESYSYGSYMIYLSRLFFVMISLSLIQSMITGLLL